MARALDAPLAGEKRNRMATLITLIILFSGGVFLAWRALHPIEFPLPPDILTALERIAKLQDPEKTSVNLPDSMCASTLDLSIVSFIISANQLEVDKKELLLPNIGKKITASLSSSAPSLSYLRAQDSVVYLDSDSILHLEKATASKCSHNVSKEEEEALSKDMCSSLEPSTPPTRLAPHQISTLGWSLYSQLPPPSSAPGTLRALVLVTPPGFRLLEIETASSKYSKMSFKISENVLLVLVPASTKEAAAAIGEEEGNNYNELAAREILNWLSAYTLDSHSSILSQQCLHKAATEILRFLKILNLAPETGVKVTADVAPAAGAAATAFTLAEESLDVLSRDSTSDTISSDNNKKESLNLRIKQSRIVWELARTLATHTDLGATPQLPSEHVLALLLPIGLPIFLAIVQAVGREVKEAKKGWLSEKNEELMSGKEKNLEVR